MKQTEFEGRGETACVTVLARGFVRRTSATVAVFAAGVAGLHAHPGHALGQEGVGHVLTSPYHLAALAGFGLAMALGARQIRRPLPRQVLRAIGMVAVAVAGVLWVAA